MYCPSATHRHSKVGEPSTLSWLGLGLGLGLRVRARARTRVRARARARVRARARARARVRAAHAVLVAIEREAVLDAGPLCKARLKPVSSRPIWMH